MSSNMLGNGGDGEDSRMKARWVTFSDSGALCPFFTAAAAQALI